MKRIVAFLALLFVSKAGHACQCAGRATVREELQSATAIFEGRVISRRMILAQEHGWFFPAPEYEFRVSRAWKGIAAPTIRLLGGYSNCAYVFQSNDPYLVFVGRHWERPDRLSSSICDRTKLAAGADADRAALGPPTTVFPETEPRRHADVERLRAYVVGGIAVYANLLRHGNERRSWIHLGFLPAGLGVLGVIALVVTLRKRRWWIALLVVSLLLAVASMVAAGQQLYSESWFSRYLE